jgi:multidrug efflux system membrane fusion protein
MKRVLYLVVFLAIAAAFYFYAYPRLVGDGSANAQTATSAQAGQKAGGPGQGARTGSFATAVVVAVAGKQTIPITKSAVGFIEAPQVAVMRTRADGLVVQQDVTEGQLVKTGDVLFRLDDGPIQVVITKDQALIARDQANANSAQAQLSRDQNLFKTQVVPQQTIDTDMAATKSAEATVAMDQAQLKADQLTLSYMTITAPIDGQVGTVNTSIGNIVHAADTSATGLLTITSMSKLRVSFSIPERDLDSFRNVLAQKQAAPVQILVAGDTAPRATGQFSFIDSSVDSSSGTISVKADVDNSAGTLWPGQYVSTVTQLGAYTDVTTVPVTAVQPSGQGSFVFVVGADNKVKQQPVTLVATVNDTAIVGPEINPGDHVVVEGQLRLADGSLVKPTMPGQTTPVATAPGGRNRPGKPGANGAPGASGAQPSPSSTPASNS